MAAELTIDSTSTATATLVGAWELRAGSHDTTEYLARGSTYPGNLDAFKPLNGDDSSSGDAANGYDPAPKMALITVTGGADGETIVLDGGIESILMVLTTDSGTSAVAVGASVSSKTITLQYLSGSANTTNVMVLYN
jgi:hypothetical protein|tara:strand:+ start:2105 stop:2515 length:411 start_codon:yes stop_codon:yes gene_type:complete